ncbi:MAG TPA: tetratricopeptide repeat protein [Thermoanaerobaculia bacterium]|nr:tetratricopeptide repeat protein [Thermoanaerobaculia bacterium]
MRRWIPWALALPLLAFAAWAAVPPNLSKALEVQQRLVQQRPQDPAVFNDLGNLLQMAARPEEAEEAYRRALELDPERVSARFNLGLLLQQRGALRKALRQYRTVLELQPRHAWAHFQVGAVLEAEGSEARAIESYAQAFRLDPQLAFPEVNPQVIESELVTEAMLQAYSEGEEPGTFPPPVYEQPNRIAELLVPPVAAPDESATERDETAGAAAAPAGQARSIPGAVAPPAGAAGSRVLQPGDLQTGGGVNQIGGGTRTGGRGIAAPQGYVPPAQPDWNAGDPEGRGPAEQPIPPPSTTVIIRNGIQSTGRLEFQLTPRRSRSVRAG